jgi:hypothetical protein
MGMNGTPLEIRPTIHGLTVCVGYASFLMQTGMAWARGLTTLTVVTSPQDKVTFHTMEAFHRANSSPCHLRLHITEKFYEKGAAFNKGAAMEEARAYMPWQDWILFFDIDIHPGFDWHRRLQQQDLQMGYLYGAHRLHGASVVDVGRLECPQVPDDRVGYGYFQLFHSKDPKVQRTPLLDTYWRHAGNYDSNFLLSFRSMVKELTDFPLWHIGPQHENWYGVGQREQFLKMMLTRRGVGGIHESEKLDE